MRKAGLAHVCENKREAASYVIDINEGTGQVRVTLVDKNGAAVGSLTVPGHEAYEFGKRVIEAYDKLEGI